MLQHDKTQTKKTSAKAKTTASPTDKASSTKRSPKQAGSPVITSQQRKQMINETAYCIAQSRGFIGGNPMDDWLKAEAEVDKQLSKTGR